MPTDFLTSAIRETEHRNGDDLLSAGLGLDGLRGPPPPFANVEAPTPPELRRRAIQANWKGIADLGPLGGYGDLYGTATGVPGREFQAFARIPGARWPHRILVQVPDAFDATARCLVVTASSGSRGIYGAIALSGAWSLPRGCAVAYTDKGAGSGYFDTAAESGSRLDGTQASIGSAELEFAAKSAGSESGIAIKHAHSGDNPEADWGRHVLQAAQFGLAMLDRAFPQHAPFTAQNTKIIAAGVSNGAGAVLQAAGLDHAEMLSGVVALAPNINVPALGRPLYDYATEAALLLPCALTDARFDAIPLARTQGAAPLQWISRCTSLHAADLLHAANQPAQATEALDRLHGAGWSDAALATAASTTAFDLWRAAAATYVSSYARAGVGSMPCGFRFVARDASGTVRAPTAAERAAWWSDAAGIAPGAGVYIDEPAAGDAADPTLPGLLCLRELWLSDTSLAKTVHASIAATAPHLPRKDLPIWIVHGTEDGLLPMAFHSDAYVKWLRVNGRTPVYWPIPHAQHFDTFLVLPGFGDRYVPLLPYGYAALDRMWRHLIEGAVLNGDETPAAMPRGDGKLDAAHLALPAD